MAEYITDLHYHSKYSRAVSRDMDLEHLSVVADIKGLHVVTAADFTHPAWFAELKKKLQLKSNGLYQLKNQKICIHFMLTSEISCIYSQGGKTRRIHLVVIMPTLDAVEKFNGLLVSEGANVKSDGRPIVGMSAEHIVELAQQADKDSLVIPAHIWTPWFSMFGSMSGFDTVEECFGKQTKNIYAIETGLSSDPPMNWRLSQLDKYSIVSFSDSHSPDKLGREATVMELESLSYKNIMAALKQTSGKNKIAYTVEFYPEEGRYHWDGHAKCKVRLSPAETRKLKGICPKCKKPVTVGVLSRVGKLADRPEGYKPANRPPFKSLVPLREIIAESIDQGVHTKRVTAEYDSILAKGGNEFNILLNLSIDELKKMTNPTIVEAIKRIREGKMSVEPGYDGEYGIVKLFTDAERKKYVVKQEKLL
ncbi:MAG: endonuclease Q family protein [Patescibacteria group bacterium]